ncbi:MAG: hypothetical protein RLN90_10305 [Balneolaceae bacterium]
METALAYFILFSPILWLVSIYLLSDWEHVWKFAAINFSVIVLYTVILLFSNIIDLGHDEYGLKRLGTFALTVSTHILLGFLFAVGYKLNKKSKLEHQT